MNQSIKTRLDKLSAKIGAGDGPRCLVTMKDGSKRIMNGFSILGYQDGFMPPDIVDIKTDDPNYYNFFGNLLAEPGKVTVSLVPRIL